MACFAAAAGGPSIHKPTMPSNPMDLYHQLLWYIPFLLRDFFRLICFVVVLSPGFLRFFWYYVFTSNRKVVRYAHESCRQTLDVYTTTTTSNDSLAPVVVFYTGGAWCIGYKMWGALLARALTPCGILVVIPDYRNYPTVCVPEMVQDVETSLQWTRRHVSQYGGDPTKIVVVGQSAGGHLACTLLLKKAVELLQTEQQDADRVATSTSEEEKIELTATTTPENDTSFQPTDFAGFISLSAPYDLDAMQSTFRRHGLDEQIVDRVFDGQGDAYTPTQILSTCQRQSLDLPPIQILHGTMDKTVPFHGSLDFYRQLQRVTNNTTTFHSYNGWSHTDGILEMPMDANHRFHKDIFDAVQQWTNSEDLVWPEDDPIIANRLCPHCLIRLGQSCNPF